MLNGNDFFRNEPQKRCIVKPLQKLMTAEKPEVVTFRLYRFSRPFFPLFVDVAGYFRPSFQGEKIKFHPPCLNNCAEYLRKWPVVPNRNRRRRKILRTRVKFWKKVRAAVGLKDARKYVIFIESPNFSTFTVNNHFKFSRNEIQLQSTLNNSKLSLELLS